MEWPDRRAKTAQTSGSEFEALSAWDLTRPTLGKTVRILQTTTLTEHYGELGAIQGSRTPLEDDDTQFRCRRLSPTASAGISDHHPGEPRMTAARGRQSEPFHGAIGFPPAPAPPGQHEERRLVRSTIPLEEKPPEFDVQKVPSIPA